MMEMLPLVDQVVGGSYGGGGPGAATPGNVVAVTNTDTPSNGAGNAGGTRCNSS